MFADKCVSHVPRSDESLVRHLRLATLVEQQRAPVERVVLDADVAEERPLVRNIHSPISRSLEPTVEDDEQVARPRDPRRELRIGAKPVGRVEAGGQVHGVLGHLSCSGYLQREPRQLERVSFSLDDLDDLGASVFVPLVIRFARRRIHQAQLQALLEISAVDPAHDLVLFYRVKLIDVDDVVLPVDEATSELREVLEVKMGFTPVLAI